MAAEPAEPILGSVLWNGYLASRRSTLLSPPAQRNGANNGNEQPETVQTVTGFSSEAVGDCRTGMRLGTGYKAVDGALKGGLEYGEGGVVCISGDEGIGCREISHGLLATHLLDGSRNTATIIDTLGTLSIPRLYSLICMRLSTKTQSIDIPDGVDVEEYAATVMDRIRIMRVFDFEGMLEGVTELREEFESSTRTQSQSHGGHGDDQTEVEKMLESELLQGPRGTVQDSQMDGDENKDLVGAEDMFPPDGSQGASPVNDPSVAAETKSDERAEQQQQQQQQQERQTNGLLIIDNLTQVISPLLKNNHAQGQALLAAFLRSLTHLTRSHDLLTLLHNTTVTYNNNNNNSHRNTAAAAAEAPPSIFSSVTARPALGKSFTFLPDVQLLVSRVTKRARDARRVYGGRQQAATTTETTQGEEAQWVSVVEVLQDRYGGRGGRFGAFEVTRDGGLSDAFR